MEILNILFALCLTAFSVWVVYAGYVKYERDERRRRTHLAVEHNHAHHWRTWRLTRGRVRPRAVRAPRLSPQRPESRAAGRLHDGT